MSGNVRGGRCVTTSIFYVFRSSTSVRRSWCPRLFQMYDDTSVPIYLYMYSCMCRVP